MNAPELSDVKTPVRAYLEKTFSFPMAAVRNDDSLFEKGVLDSLGFLQLLSFLEKRFKITFAVTEIAIDNFDSLDTIAEIVNRKWGSTAK